MPNSILSPNRRIHVVWEGILKWFAFAIMCLQLALGILQYLLPYTAGELFIFEQWAAVLLVVMTFAYVVYTRICVPQLLFRIRDFVKGMLCPESIILLLFFVWSIICTASIGKRYDVDAFLYNDSVLFDIFVSAFIIFIIGYVFRGATALKMMETLFHVLCILLTALMVYVLYEMCSEGIVELPEKGYIYMTSDVRLCINCHPNTTGAIAEIIFMMCLYMVVTKKRLVRCFYIIAACVHYIVLVLSNSRTCIITTAISVAAVFGKLCYDALKNKELWKRILITAIVSIVAAAFIIELRGIVFAAYDEATYLADASVDVGPAISHVSASDDGTQPVISFVAAAVDDSASVAREAEMTFGLRTELWIAAMKSVLQDANHFFFGVTPTYVMNEVSYWSESHRQLYTHNQFCEIAVAHGIPGLLMYITWLGLVARSCIRIVRGRIESEQKEMIVLCGMILMLVISNMTEATLMYYRWFMEAIFFLTCGVVTYGTKNPKNKK